MGAWDYVRTGAKVANRRALAVLTVRRPHAPMLPCPHAPTLPRSLRSFTLIELLIVVALSGIIFTALAAFTRTTLSTTGVVQDQNTAAQTARTALARLAREASLAKTVSAAEPARLAFTCTDITGDGLDDALEYRWDTATQTLTRTLNGVSGTFAERVTSFLFEYQYETEQSVVIAAGGSTVNVTIASFTGGSGGGDKELDVYAGTGAIQRFLSASDATVATSATIRVKTKTSPWPYHDALIALKDSSGSTVALGTLNRTLVTGSFVNITVPLTWIAGSGTRVEFQKQYTLQIQSTGDWPGYCGTIKYRDGTTVPAGYAFGTSLPLDTTDSAYFTVSGNLQVTTPRHATTTTSVLKTIKATMSVTEGAQQVQLSRTCKVVNQ